MQPTSKGAEVTLAEPATAADSAAAAAFGIGSAPRDPDRWQFVRAGGQMALIAPRAEGSMRLEVHAGSSGVDRRVRSSRPSDPLLRAVGVGKGRNPPTAVDATGGLCRDAMLLANMDCHVTVLERVPALALLGHWRIASAGLADRAGVTCADAVAWLAALPAGHRPDVVCLDPMFESRGKAQVKKDMQVCRLLAGPPGDPAALLAVARRAARARVVVKRHPDLPALGDGVAFTVDGERVRFDVYLAPAPG